MTKPFNKKKCYQRYANFWGEEFLRPDFMMKIPRARCSRFKWSALRWYKHYYCKYSRIVTMHRHFMITVFCDKDEWKEMTTLLRRLIDYTNVTSYERGAHDVPLNTCVDWNFVAGFWCLNSTFCDHTKTFIFFIGKNLLFVSFETCLNLWMVVSQVFSANFNR